MPKFEGSANKNYRLVWDGNFQSGGIDPALWCFKCDMAADDVELSYQPPVAQVEDGILKLRTLRLPNAADGSPRFQAAYSFSTYDTMNYRYGYVEMRARLPYHQGAWPGFWMKSLPCLCERRCPEYFAEIDVLEVFSNETALSCNLHKWYADGRHTMLPGDETGVGSRVYRFDASPDATWHTYGMEWTPKAMTFYVDRKPFYSHGLTDADDFDGNGEMRGFHDCLYVIVNNMMFTPAMKWKPAGALVNDETRFPICYDIEYIRLYQDANEPGTELHLGDPNKKNLFWPPENK